MFVQLLMHHTVTSKDFFIKMSFYYKGKQTSHLDWGFKRCISQCGCLRRRNKQKQERMRGLHRL